ncbi:MAG TPA: hypothetical protein VK853_05095 [Ilumatobacteraceae bacterium]|nr:hypothetical protein [Ilumatobacteraceae bacterium]
MTNHDPTDRPPERQRGTATAERLTTPPGTQAGDPQRGAPHAEPPPARPAFVQHDEEIRVIERTERTGPRLDRVRWSAIWAGLVVTLALYLFLQLTLVATGIVDLADATTADAWWSAAAALVAFLIGGVVTGATAVWRDADDGLLHGVVMWAVGLVALIALAAFGGGIALGSFDTSDVFDDITSADVDAAVESGDAEEAASWAIIGLTSALVASALGATAGSKMWPRRRTDADDTEFRS